MRYELTGYVKNLPDRSVELLIQGHPEDIANCLTDIKDSFGNYIRDAKAVQLPADPRYTDFRISF
jgi:acylphosphatase